MLGRGAEARAQCSTARSCWGERPRWVRYGAALPGCPIPYPCFDLTSRPLPVRYEVNIPEARIRPRRFRRFVQSIAATEAVQCIHSQDRSNNGVTRKQAQQRQHTQCGYRRHLVRPNCHPSRKVAGISKVAVNLASMCAAATRSWTQKSRKLCACKAFWSEASSESSPNNRPTSSVSTGHFFHFHQPLHILSLTMK